MLLSGGLDSATVLAIAREAGFNCHAIAFDYGQRHRHELDAARRVAAALGAASFRVFPLDTGSFGGSALTDDAVARMGSAAKMNPPTWRQRRARRGADSRCTRR